MSDNQLNEHMEMKRSKADVQTGQMPTQYCFIVGLPRTGTKLMVSVLEGAPNKQCYIAPENFFLGRAFLPGVRKRMKRFGDLHLDRNVHLLVDAMYNRHFHGEFWDRLADGTLGIEQEAMRGAILATDRSEHAIYNILLESMAHIMTPYAMTRDKGKGSLLLGDKTGPHLYHVPTLLKWYPQAKIVHTFRDPRAILASEHKKRLQQLHYRSGKRQHRGDYVGALAFKLACPLVSLLIVLYITTAWLRAAHLHYRYQRRYPHNYILSRFEDLVGQPQETVEGLCHFLNLEFDAGMLNPPRVDSSFEQKQETGFDQQTLDRWQNVLSPWMKTWLRYSLGGYLRALGYHA